MVLAFSWTFVVILETNQNFFDQGWHQALFKAQDSEIYWEPNHVSPLLPSGDNFKNKGILIKKKFFSLEPLVGIFQIWRLLLWFYSVAPSPGADNIWIYFISHLLLLQAIFTYSKSFFITITIKWCFCWSAFSWRRIHITLILSHHPCNRQHCTKNEVSH